MLDRLKRSHPFQTPDTKRLAILFAVVYFAQDMWSLPHQTLIITLKERGLSAGQVATFFTFSIIPWLIKPTYEFLSDFVPLFGQRRRSYLLLTSLLAAGAGLAMGLAVPHSYWWLTGLFTIMGLGLAFTDVLVDALMVENGKPRGLTGASQAVQWGAIYTPPGPPGRVHLPFQPTAHTDGGLADPAGPRLGRSWAYGVRHVVLLGVNPIGTTSVIK